jgi:uncharacterized protein (TIGR02757 family)
VHNAELKAYCDAAYARYHSRKYVSPDPLELVLPFESLPDREIAGFIAAALALGRVGGIIRAAGWVLDRLGPPHACLLDSTDQELHAMAAPFRYRFFDGSQLAGLLVGLKHVLAEFGSLQACLAAGIRDSGSASSPPPSLPAAPDNTEPAVAGLGFLVDRVITGAGGELDQSILVARPERGSACKRLLLFLRWMVRSDAVDPGGWTALTPAQLMVPVDTHMLSICREVGLTTARQASLAVSREVTAAFSVIAPDDPVRYDFSLTRMGIHPDAIRDAKSRL